MPTKRTYTVQYIVSSNLNISRRVKTDHNLECNKKTVLVINIPCSH